MGNIKLPHVVQIILGCAGLVVTYLLQQQAAGGVSLPAVAIGVLSLLHPLLGLFSPAINAPAVKDAAVTVATLVVVSVLGAMGLTLCACGGGQASQQTAVTAYAAAEQACIATADGSLAAAEACIAGVKATYCNDGGALAGLCLDGGAK